MASHLCTDVVLTYPDDPKNRMIIFFFRDERTCGSPVPRDTLEIPFFDRVIPIEERVVVIKDEERPDCGHRMVGVITTEEFDVLVQTYCPDQPFDKLYLERRWDDGAMHIVFVATGFYCQTEEEAPTIEAEKDPSLFERLITFSWW